MTEKILYTLKAPSEVPMVFKSVKREELPEISIGSRPCWNLIELAKKENQSIRVPSGRDFYLQELFCSFGPTKEKIDNAELEIIVEEPSRVYQMAPREIVDAIEHENEFGVSGELNIEPLKAGINYVHKWKSKSVVSKLYVFGVGESTAKWEFSRGRQDTLHGTQDLNLIIMTPKGEDASMRLELSGSTPRGIVFKSRDIPPEKKVIRVGARCAS